MAIGRCLPLVLIRRLLHDRFAGRLRLLLDPGIVGALAWLEAQRFDRGAFGDPNEKRDTKFS